MTTFLVDYDNGAQSFCQTKLASLPSGIEVIVFVRRGSAAQQLLPKWIKWVETSTESPEAADVRLIAYAAQHFANPSSYHFSTKKKVWIVCGGEKGYGELLALVHEAGSYEIGILDARMKKLIDFIPDACSYCDKMLDWMERDSHKNVRCSNPYCETVFTCKGELERQKEQHSVQGFKSCPEECNFRFCAAAYNGKQPVVISHPQSHPLCSDSTCNCQKRFLNDSSLQDHYSLLRLFPHPCNFCDERFKDRGQLAHHVWAHQDKYPPDQVCSCGQPFLDKQYKKNHLQKCKVKKAP